MSKSGLATDEERAAETPETTRRSARAAGGVIGATGVLLAGAFFPLMFNRFVLFDDEGVFLVTLRQLLNHHGSLYVDIWADKYGPFYYLFATSVYRIIGQQPSLENGRWIVLVVTTASATLFAAAVWRVTKSIPCSILCEVAAFLILIGGAGNEPMHPGSLAVLLVAGVAYALSSYSVARRNTQLILLGAAIGALLMTKINIGLFVVIAIVTAFTVGNQNMPRRIRTIVVALAVLAPFVVMFQNISTAWAGTFAVIVAVSVLGIAASITVDLMSLPKRALLTIGSSAAAVIVGSLAFPLITGTPPVALLKGVFAKPFGQAAEYSSPVPLHFDWLIIVVVVVGLCAALGVRHMQTRSVEAQLIWRHVALAAGGLWLLGLGTIVTKPWNLGEWLPALSLVPAFAIASAVPESVRFALRSLVLVAAFQVLGAYPVAGAQIRWGSVAMTVPCAVAVAAGIDRIDVWRELRGATRALTTGALCLVLVVVSSAWPPAIWKTYNDSPSLGLPGTGLLRVDPAVRDELRTVTQVLRTQCDTFYSVPAVNSFYIFARIPPLTGLAGNFPGGLDDAQQHQVVRLLRKAATHERVCIVRDLSRSAQVAAGYGSGRIHNLLQEYGRVIKSVGIFSIAKHN